MTKLTGIKIEQVQALVKNASQEGVCIGHCYFFDGQLVEGMIQLPSMAPGRITLSANGHPARDIRAIRTTETDVPHEFELEILTELGALFVDMFLPKAA